MLFYRVLFFLQNFIVLFEILGLYWFSFRRIMNPQRYVLKCSLGHYHLTHESVHEPHLLGGITSKEPELRTIFTNTILIDPDSTPAQLNGRMMIYTTSERPNCPLLMPKPMLDNPEQIRIHQLQIDLLIARSVISYLKPDTLSWLSPFTQHNLITEIPFFYITLGTTFDPHTKNLSNLFYSSYENINRPATHHLSNMNTKQPILALSHQHSPGNTLIQGGDSINLTEANLCRLTTNLENRICKLANNQPACRLALPMLDPPNTRSVKNLSNSVCATGEKTQSYQCRADAKSLDIQLTEATTQSHNELRSLSEEKCISWIKECEVENVCQINSTAKRELKYNSQPSSSKLSAANKPCGARTVIFTAKDQTSRKRQNTSTSSKLCVNNASSEQVIAERFIKRLGYGSRRSGFVHIPRHRSYSATESQSYEWPRFEIESEITKMHFQKLDYEMQMVRNSAKKHKHVAIHEWGPQITITGQNLHSRLIEIPIQIGNRRVTALFDPRCPINIISHQLACEAGNELQPICEGEIRELYAFVVWKTFAIHHCLNVADVFINFVPMLKKPSANPIMVRFYVDNAEQQSNTMNMYNTEQQSYTMILGAAFVKDHSAFLNTQHMTMVIHPRADRFHTHLDDSVTVMVKETIPLIGYNRIIDCILDLTAEEWEKLQKEMHPYLYRRPPKDKRVPSNKIHHNFRRKNR